MRCVKAYTTAYQILLFTNRVVTIKDYKIETMQKFQSHIHMQLYVKDLKSLVLIFFQIQNKTLF